MVCFLVAGLTPLHLGAAWMGYPPDWWFDVTWDLRTVGLFAGALVASFAGGVVGAGIGISIPVKSDRVDHAITVLWHYLANGYVVFITLFVLTLPRTVGDKHQIMALVKQVGSTSFTLQISAAAAVSSAGGALLLLLFGLVARGGKPRLVAALLVTAPISLLAARWLFGTYGFDSRLWILIGVVHPPVTIVLSAWFILRDALSRAQAREDLI
jgi:hypothetical protein